MNGVAGRVQGDQLTRPDQHMVSLLGTDSQAEPVEGGDDKGREMFGCQEFKQVGLVHQRRSMAVIVNVERTERNLRLPHDSQSS